MNREELIEEAANAMSQGFVQAGRVSSFFALAETALAVFEKAQCKRCGQPAEGYAFIGDDRYCHPDDGVDCYTLASHDLTILANQAFIEKAQAPTIQFSARRIGKSQALIDSMLAQANERGIRVEVVYPQTEPTDAQAIAARDELQRRGYGGASLFAMRAALRAAFTAGQERAAEAQPRGKSCAVNGCRHAARWQDSGSVDYCACHYDDSAPDEECTAGQEARAAFATEQRGENRD